MRLLIVALSVVAWSTGCVRYLGDRVPNMIQDGAEAPESLSPSMRIVFTHEHQLEGDPRKGGVRDRTEAAMLQALDRVRASHPLLARAAIDPSHDVQYLLFLDTVFNEHGQAAAIISGSSFLLIPVTTSFDVVVTASLYEAHSGEKVGVYESSVEQKTFIWLPLTLALPISIIAGPTESDLYDDTYRDMLAQISGDLDGREHPRYVAPGSIVIDEEPAHIKRTIRSLPQ